MKKELFCHVCDDYKVIYVVRKNVVYMVRDEEIEIQSEVSTCVCCGGELFDKELDEANIERAIEKYRKNHGLLTSNEIKTIRDTYGLSQRAFSRLLKWAHFFFHRLHKFM